MIQINELRVGNLVTLNDNHRIFQVKNLRAVPVLRLAAPYSSCEILDYGYNDLRGIPLSPEVLEACGFKFIQSTNTYRSGQIFLHWRQKRNAWMINIHKQPMKFLHQLQNYAFACYGRELICSPKTEEK